MNDIPSSTTSIVVYKPAKGGESLSVQFKRETVWLSLDGMAQLFERDKSVISRHIKNVFAEKELNRKAVVANFATTAADGKTYQVDYYNLDVIISVGYRVKSHNGVRFRMWATGILRDYILNRKKSPELLKKQLSEFGDTVLLFKKIIETRQLSTKEESGLLKVITEYANSWVLLQQYDKGKMVDPEKTTKTTYKLEYSEAQNAIAQLKDNLLSQKEASNLFGVERHNGLDQIVNGLYQTFSGRQLYPNVEDKAAHLLYFIIKDHPFSDGNKRIASFLFIVFLARNNCLLRKNGERKINDNAMVALALLVAESEAKQKDIMTKLIMNFLAE